MHRKMVGTGAGIVILVLAVVVLVTTGPPAAAPVPKMAAAGLPALSVPDGFTLNIFSADVPGARSLSHGTNGTVFVGTRDRGNVYALRDTDGDGKADRTWTIAANLFMPNGVAFRNGSLYVAEVNRILRFDDIENNLDNPLPPVTVFSALPSDTYHGWKFIRFGPDGRLYVPIGMPCNICDPPGEWYGTILRIYPGGSGPEIFASGIRNSVGFDWDPRTGDLWFTDNGRDWLGDDLPPDELNHAPSAGMNFGFPDYYGKCTENPEYAGKQHPANCTPTAFELPAHVASLGMRFYTGSMFPEDYRNEIFIAEHGSWNRAAPIGYQVILVTLVNGTPVSEKPFVTGFLTQDGTVLGRPVDVEVLPDGSLLISDDLSGKIYRVTYTPGVGNAG
ncbi:MAG: PQQ-dependent sugar dehydrogenase [Methanoregulaceae archaeon]